MRPDAAMATFPCPACGAVVVAGEVRRGGHAMFAGFEVADIASMYLQLPSHPVQLAPRFVPSIFGDHALHGCFVSATFAIPRWLSGYGPERPILPS